MAYRFHDDDGFVYFETGAFGHPFHRRRPERALCGQRRWPGSHVACVCYADHEGRTRAPRVTNGMTRMADRYCRRCGIPIAVVPGSLDAVEHGKWYELGLCLGSGHPTLAEEPAFRRGVSFTITLEIKR